MILFQQILVGGVVIGAVGPPLLPASCSYDERELLNEKRKWSGVFFIYFPVGFPSLSV